MQSGISVSPELHEAFTNFTSDTSLFCLPITITSESLTPLSPLPFASGGRDFYSSLPQLSSTLQPKTPMYLLFRRGPEASSSLIALTYIPSNAPVRAKTLFASTRATVVRELGSEKFGTTVFATEEEEVVSAQAWRERDIDSDGTGNGNGGGSTGSYRREDLMGEKERELEAVRRAEDEARSGTAGRDVGIGGTLQRSGGAAGGGGMSMKMPVDEDAKEALRSLQDGGLVQLAIDIPSETIKLASSVSDVAPGSLESQISQSAPRYSFYHYPSSDTIVFIYTCPSSSSIKERMLYASTRRVAIDIGESEGLKISKRIEGSSPDEITEARLYGEVHPQQDEGPKRGFARPKRPGR